MEKVLGDVMYLAHMAMDDEIKGSLELLEAEGKQPRLRFVFYWKIQKSNPCRGS